MGYEGEKFLLKLYRDMYNDESVKHSSIKSDNKYEAVKKYIDRLERVHEKAINHKTDTGIKLLKNFYYDKYVIKKEDISDSYMNYLDKVQFDRYGTHMTQNQKEGQKDLMIEDQKNSLDEWIDYFISEDAKFYPTWAKYWAFQGMLKIGNYDAEKGTYNSRTKKTVAPFPELDREVLAKTIDLVIKEVNKEKIEDKDLEQLVKNGNFFKLYTVQLKDKRESNFGEETKGEWVKYEQGDNYQKLYKSLQGKNTGWCTAGEATCKEQVKNGDFYVYYTYDKEGKATNPRLAIRMDEKEKIGEIRGVAQGQNIEPHFEDILSKKLEKFKDAEDYKKRVKDTQMLTYVYTKYENDKSLTKEDIKFIYGIDYKIRTMGWRTDPRLQEMRENTKNRKTKDSLSKDEIIVLAEKSCDYYNGKSLSFIPKEMINKEIALELVKQDGLNLEYVLKERIDKEIALAAVKNDGKALEYVPKNIIDKDIALATVKNDGTAIEYVPENMIDKDIVLAAIKQSKEFVSKVFKYVPENMIDKEIALVAVQVAGFAIEYIPKELIDKDMIIMAVQNDELALNYVPKEMIDKEVLVAAAKKSAFAIKDVENLIDKDMAMAIVQENGTAIRFIPRDLIDKDMILAAIQNRAEAINCIPKDLIDKDIAIAAVQKSGYIVGSIPENVMDKDIAMVAAINYEAAINWIPKELRDKDIVMIAVQNHPEALRYIPRNLIDKDIVMAAVQNQSDPEEFLRDMLIDDDIIKEVLKEKNNEQSNNAADEKPKTR